MRAFKTQVVYATKLQSDYAHRGPADGGEQCCPVRGRSYRAIALTGQVPAQEPHSMHLEASMLLLPSTSLIAATGQEDSQAPQLMQTSGFTL